MVFLNHTGSSTLFSLIVFVGICCSTACLRLFFKKVLHLIDILAFANSILNFFLKNFLSNWKNCLYRPYQKFNYLGFLCLTNYPTVKLNLNHEVVTKTWFHNLNLSQPVLLFVITRSRVLPLMWVGQSMSCSTLCINNKLKKDWCSSLRLELDLTMPRDQPISGKLKSPFINVVALYRSTITSTGKACKS